MQSTIPTLTNYVHKSINRQGLLCTEEMTNLLDPISIKVHEVRMLMTNLVDNVLPPSETRAQQTVPFPPHKCERG